MTETLNTLLKTPVVIFMAGTLLDMGLRLRLGTALGWTGSTARRSCEGQQSWRTLVRNGNKVWPQGDGS